MKDGTFVDFGGQWVGSTQERFYALIREMGGETYPSPGGGLVTLQRGILDTRRISPHQGRHRRELSRRRHLRQGQEGGERSRDDGRRAGAVDASRRHAARRPHLRANGCAQNVENESVRKLIATEVGSVPSASAEEISMLHLGWLIHACDEHRRAVRPRAGGPRDRRHADGRAQGRREARRRRSGSGSRCAGSNGATRARPCIPMR